MIVSARVETIKSLRKNKANAEEMAKQWQDNAAAAEWQIAALEGALSAEEKQLLDPAPPQQQQPPAAPTAKPSGAAQLRDDATGPATAALAESKSGKR